MQTFLNLPESISTAVAGILARSSTRELAAHAAQLHERYMTRAKENGKAFVQSPSDILAYLALRAPATYAQIASALLQIQTRVPNWKPKTVLDLGCGPGTGVWAAKTIWPELSDFTGIDQEQYFLSLAQEILHSSHLDIACQWKKMSLNDWIETNESSSYDLIIVANVLNELSQVMIERLLYQLAQRSSGIVIILEPGTSIGYQIIQTTAETLAKSQQLVAPYIDSFQKSDEYWIHFPQKFIRPEYQRMIRQSMRESSLMASDWEETKFSYVAFGNVQREIPLWAQCVGPSTKYHGYLTIPLLTKEGVIHQKVMKRYKAAYTTAKNTKWGEILHQPMLLETPVA